MAETTDPKRVNTLLDEVRHKIMGSYSQFEVVEGSSVTVQALINAEETEDSITLHAIRLTTIYDGSEAIVDVLASSTGTTWDEAIEILNGVVE